jgi:transglutaminase-like putative cysteine protease
LSFLTNKFHISSGQELPPDRQALLSLICAFFLSISPHTGRLPAWFALLAIVVLTWRYKIITANVHQPGRFVRISILIIVIFLLFLHYQTLLGRDAGVAMLIALTMLKFLELKSLRDYMLVVFLCLFIVMTSFLYSQSLWLGFYLLAVVIILFTVMMYLNHRDRSDLLGMLKRAASLVLVGLPVAILLFVLFPRLQGGLFGLPGDSHSGLTGMSDTMKPGTINELNLSEKIAFRVEFLAPLPTAQQRYWRGLVLENYQQGTWKENKDGKSTGSLVKYSDNDVIEYTILQEATNKKWIFALDIPISKRAGLRWGSGQTLRSDSVMHERQQNHIKSALVYKFIDMSESELAINMDVSAVTGERVTELAKRLYRQSASDRDYINKVLAYYRNNDFIYNLQPPLLGEHPIENFMLDTRAGYCEHYASSFTMMMRLAGVPARVVIGYQGGEWNEQGNYLIVRQSDAHAWSEVWLDESGWVRIDPTSAVAPERIEYGISAIRQLIEQGQELGNLSQQQLQTVLTLSILSRSLKNFKLFWDGVNTRWYKWVIGFGSKNQISMLKWFGFKQANVRILIILLVALVSLVVIIQAWILFRRKKVLDPAVRQYQIYCQRLSRIGIVRSNSEGPRAFARRVLLLRPDLRELVLPVVEAYIAIQYAGKISNEQHQKLIRAVRNFKPGRRKIALNNS